MKWIKTVDNDLLNLEHIYKIYSKGYGKIWRVACAIVIVTGSKDIGILKIFKTEIEAKVYVDQIYREIEKEVNNERD